MGRLYPMALFATLNYRASSAAKSSDVINSAGSGIIDIETTSILWQAEPSRSRISQVPVAVRLDVNRRVSTDYYTSTAGRKTSVRTAVTTGEASKRTTKL
jgi:hypothetical protein